MKKKEEKESEDCVMKIEKTEYLTKEEICKKFPHKWVGLVEENYKAEDTGKFNPIGGCVVIVAEDNDDDEVEFALVDGIITARFYTSPEDQGMIWSGINEVIIPEESEKFRKL